MSNISKLAIKACKDNTFSSFSGEFVTSINPENLIIKSAVEYHPNVIGGFHSLKYSQSPPRLLTFSLLFDNTGIIPGSNTIHVMEQIEQLQDVAYNVNKKNNAPNYIRVIWGQIDFKGRLIDLNVTYSMFQADGTLIRAEAIISVLEERPPSGGGKSALGKENDRVKRSTSAPSSIAHQPTPPSYEESFAPTPNGTSGPYSGAPEGAYNGGPDHVYRGTGSSSGAGKSSGVGSTLKNNASVSDNSLKVRDVEVATFEGATIGGGEIKGGSIGGGEIKGGSIKGGSSKGGVAGNGPGGCGGGIGGGGSEPGNSSSGSGLSNGSSSDSSDTVTQNRSGGSSGGQQSSNSSTGSDAPSSKTTTSSFSNSSSNSTNKEVTKKSSKNSSGNSLRKSKTPSVSVPTDIPIPKLRPWQRLALMAKKVCTKGYNAAKKVVS